MKLNGLLNRKKYITNDTQRAVRKDIPEGIYLKCPKCKKNSYRADLRSNLGVCPQCGYHYPLSPQARIYLLVDKGSFEEFDADYERANPLEFSGYEEKRLKYQKKTHMHEAVVTGRCKIKGHEAMLAVMNSGFMMGSMGCVVGEKITRLVERATKAQLPLIIFTASGGARMQEGIFSLMQMAKTSAALAKHHQAGLLYMSILTDPTTGGVIASFASQGDIILSEPGALVGFAGPRVIEQTIRQKLPEGFQSAEFLLEKGQIDCIVPRHEMKDTLALLLTYHEREDA